MSTPPSWATASTTYTLTSECTPSHPPSTPLHRTRFPDVLSDPLPSEKPRLYPGSGTSEDPYVVDWDLNDPEDPHNWSNLRRWFITAQVSFFFLKSRGLISRPLHDSWLQPHSQSHSAAPLTVAVCKVLPAIFTSPMRLPSSVFPSTSPALPWGMLLARRFPIY